MIKKLLKREKGVSLLTLTIAVVVILTLTDVIILNLNNNLKIERLKNLQTDVANLRDKISNYYAEYGSIPIVNTEYNNIEAIENAGLISEANDSGRFYAIDLKKLEGLTLNYGRDYSNIKETSTAEEINNYTDLYIINSASHNIFYARGVKIDSKMYYTDYLPEDVDKAPVTLRYVDDVRIPAGFYYVEGKRDTGIVISDVEGDDIQNSKRGNQYVWVPVDDFEEFVREDFGNQNIAVANFVDTEETTSKYYEETGDGVSASDEVQKMYRSVKQNKGFYISRFEAGIGEKGQVVSQKGATVYNSVKLRNAANEKTGAIELARSVYPVDSENAVVSTLCYGVQWDAIMRWISKDTNSSEYLTDSRDIGNYSSNGEALKAGTDDSYQTKNIYDLAGNVSEWTMENYSENNYTIRGGDFSKIDAASRSMAYRTSESINYANTSTGFRVALYIKADAPGVKMPTEDSVANPSETTFETNYERIDVVWLDENNNIRETPEPPVLNSTSGNMTPVTWSYNSETKTWDEDATAQTQWYSYTAEDNTEDNTSSRWANAKNADESYFVWIPRYAYRITYYESETSTEPTGYYDGWGMWRAEDGKLKYNLDSGIETVVYNDTKYIVHPAFETDLDNGGWDSDLKGFWVAKYEMSRENSTDGTIWTTHGTSDYGGGDIQITDTNKDSIRAISKPNVSSWRDISIGNCYTNSFGYDRLKESHLMKNSEWEAVTYLTHSQYGRNGYEVDINNSKECITGNGGGSVDASSVPEIANEYNTQIGAKASTTGNIYGIYDISGGAKEYLAIFNKLGESTDVEGENYGLSMTKDSEGNYVSTKYVTTYSNGTEDYSGLDRILYGFRTVLCP